MTEAPSTKATFDSERALRRTCPSRKGRLMLTPETPLSNRGLYPPGWNHRASAARSKEAAPSARSSSVRPGNSLSTTASPPARSAWEWRPCGTPLRAS
ncbi:MAG: hypothetical protein ACRDSJ_01895 [Rubrobacteraceae bacterium]